jgi:hypothetical protein
VPCCIGVQERFIQVESVQRQQAVAHPPEHGPWLVREEPPGYDASPSRFFNTTGPCHPLEHYMLPTEARLVGAQLDRYIRNKLYWVLPAPRQTGKSTFLLSWMRELNAARVCAACYSRPFAADAGSGFRV